MSKKIFRLNIITALLVLTASIVLIMGILFNYFEAQLMTELENETGYIAGAVEEMGEDYIKNLSVGSKRITLIAPDGNVICDTAADAGEMGSHADRVEFKDALSNGSGKSIRYSATLTEKTINYALRLTNGAVLRLSTTRYSLITVFMGILQPILVVFLLAAVLSFVLSGRVSRAIIKPINELNLDDAASNETYEELTPLLSRISHQRRTIENQLREAKTKQEEFRLITENMNEGFLVIDAATNLLTYNHAALRLLGEDEVSEGSVFMLNRTKGFREVIKKALSGERAESEIEHSERSYSLIANPVREEGTLIGAVIIIFDVTERTEREKLRREFTSNVSHELKTPLTSISGFAEILKEGGNSEETVKDFAQSVYDEAQRLICLVNDIIKISEFDEKNIRFENGKVDLYAVSERVLKRIRPSADRRGIETDLIGESCVVSGNESIIEEMIFNLCDNAVKYNREHGKVDVIITCTEKKAKITVRDTGIGIPFASQSRVFERFYRVDKSHSKAIGGTGLGLSIVKHAAMYHNAAIELESTEGKGTSISVVFER